MATGYNQFLGGMSGKVGAMVVTTRGEATVMRKRNYENKSQSAPQKRARAAIRNVSQLWAAATPAQMAGWKTLGAQMTDAKSGRPLSNFQAFTSVNALLISCNQLPSLDAPGAPLMPVALPPILLSITNPAAGPFALTVHSAAYSGMVQVYATAPVSAGRTSFSKADYKLIGTLDGLTPVGTNLAALYTARYSVPAVGKRIAVRLSPVSDAGFKGGSLDVNDLVSPTAASAFGAADSGEDALRAA